MTEDSQTFELVLGIHGATIGIIRRRFGNGRSSDEVNYRALAYANLSEEDGESEAMSAEVCSAEALSPDVYASDSRKQVQGQKACTTVF